MYVLLEFWQKIIAIPIMNMGVGKGGGAQGPGPPWFLAIAGQSWSGVIFAISKYNK